MNIACICRQSASIGTGHLARANILANALVKAGHRLVFIGQVAAAERISEVFARIYSDCNIYKPAKLLGLLRDEKIDFCVVDDYDIDLPWQINLREFGMRFMIYEDCFKRVNCADIEVQLCAPLDKKYISQSLQVLRGLHYAPLDIPLQPRNKNPNAIAIIFGSEMPPAASSVLSFLATFPKLSINIYGGVNKDIQHRYVPYSHIHFCGFVPRKQLFLNCAFCISSVSTVCLESLALKIPGFYFVVADNQLSLAAELQRKGVDLAIDIEDSSDWQPRLQLALKILESSEAATPPQLVDDRGAQRLVAEISEIAKELAGV